jgi:arylsulfatase K
MWSLLGELPKTHTFQSYGKLDFMSGGHSQLARLSAWLAPLGLRRPVFDEDHSQSYTVDESTSSRYHEGDWRKVDQALEFIENHKNDEEPMFLYVSTGLVHAAFHTNRYWLDRIPEDLVDVPPVDESDHLARRHQLMAKAWRYGYDEKTVRQVRRIYMAMIAEVDAMIGAVYDGMQKAGMAEDTYFVVASDHGELALEHQDWYKMSLYDASSRVPLLMSGPQIKAGRRISNIVSLIDLCPTFIDMGGLQVQRELDGESLLPLATGRTTESRNWAYACFMGCTANTSSFMLRKDRWKYLVHSGFEPQLFDMQEDPGELADLSSRRPEVVRSLDAQLRQVVDYEETNRDWTAYCKEAFRQWRRQAKRGLHVDNAYALKGNPSSDYWKIMDNCFTGYDENDERRVEAWLSES